MPALLSEASKSEAPPPPEGSGVCELAMGWGLGFEGGCGPLWVFAIISARFFEDMSSFKSGCWGVENGAAECWACIASEGDG